MKRDKYTSDELALWTMSFDDKRGRHWATATLGQCGLTSASVSVHPRSSTAAGQLFVTVHAGTDYLDDSISLSMSCDVGSNRMFELIAHVQDLDDEVRQWVIDRVTAAATVRDMLVMPASTGEVTA